MMLRQQSSAIVDLAVVRVRTGDAVQNVEDARDVHFETDVDERARRCVDDESEPPTGWSIVSRPPRAVRRSSASSC